VLSRKDLILGFSGLVQVGIATLKDLILKLSLRIN
jgi:hypothetical protein